MGRRTEHQADAKAQLVVKVHREGPLVEGEADSAESLDQAGSEMNVLELAENSAAHNDVLEEIRVSDGAGESFSCCACCLQGQTNHRGS